MVHDVAESVVSDFRDASTYFDHNRLPELFCGVADVVHPTEYPTACNPQAWGVGAPYLLLRALFDVSIGTDGTVQIGQWPSSVSEGHLVRLLKSNNPSQL